MPTVVKLRHYKPNGFKLLRQNVTWILCIFALSTYLTRSSQNPGNPAAFRLKIIVLAMNRVHPTHTLLESLAQTDFDGDLIDLHISFDFHPEQREAIDLAKSFDFKHGTKRISVASEARGLAASWFKAWQPRSEASRAIILEDDIELSPDWYKLLKRLWLTYGEVEDLAGISLQRQTLIPYVSSPERHIEIENDHMPFLYPLVGSIAFSPHPTVWKMFLIWIDSIDLSTFDVSTPGLITSDWWNRLDKKHMWTQHYIYYCLVLDYYTLYVNLPGGKTAAAHLRAKGAHFQSNQGHDFSVAKSINSQSFFLSDLERYQWNGEMSNLPRSATVNQEIVDHTLGRNAQRISDENGFVYLMFLNSGFLEMVKSWVCNIERVAPEILHSVIFVSSDSKTSRDLHAFNSKLLLFTQHSPWTLAADFGTFAYYNTVLERMRVQLKLLQMDVTIMIIEADQIWFENINNDLRDEFLSSDLVVVEEGVIEFDGQKITRVCGGFYGIRPNIKEFFESYFLEYEASLRMHAELNGSAEKLQNFQDDQAFLTIYSKQNGIATRFLPSCVYVTGEWYAASSSLRQLCPMPKVVHNNYIIGQENKVFRAKSNDHWYLSENGVCLRYITLSSNE